MLLLALNLEGAMHVQRATKLLTKIVLVACVHVGVLIIVYGRKWLRVLPAMHGWGIFICLLLPSCAACYLYYGSLSGAGLFAAPHRQGKVAACSIAATLFSLYWGVFFSLNNFGS
jgi:hypothetical protein